MLARASQQMNCLKLNYLYHLSYKKQEVIYALVV